MSDNMQEQRSYGFIVGLLTGTLIGAGLALWLTPNSAAELRGRATDAAKGLGKRATDRYQQASARVGDKVEDITRRANDVRDEVASSVARGAREVERLATAAKSDGARTRS
ncbi:MAG: YtxH domain-containing protein [Vicinamibacterales bacterium]